MNHKTRRINLSGIHAINWYGYSHDYIPVTGNFLLAGVMGSGKSIIMDLIQHVLVGNEKSRYNASATGSTSGRSYKGYCLGDLKDEIAGITQYFRPKGAVTIIALEFTWPDGERKETWGFRTEWANSIQNTPTRNDAFYVPDALDQKDLLRGEPRRPLDYAAFKELVKGEAGRIFETIEEYRRDMANNSHLNFDRDTIDYLLPSAMSFTFLKGGFNRFCRQFVLPEEPLRTEDVRDSYMAFKKLEIDLKEIEDKIGRLEQIEKTFGEWSAANTDLVCYDVLQKEFALKAAAQAQDENAASIESLERENAEITQNLDQARKDKEIANASLLNVMTLINATPEGAVFLRVKDENKDLAWEIERLKGIGKTVADAVQHRLKLSQRWISELKASGFKVPQEVIVEAENAHAALAAAPQEQIRSTTRILALAIDAAKTALEAATRDVHTKYNENLAKMQRLQKEIEGLHSGFLTENAALLTSLNRELPPRNGQPAARALRQLCEVNDEKWRAALEVVFNQKFAVVVSPEDYPKANKIFYELKANASSESLIIPQRALNLRGKVHPNSLASKLDTNHPVARAFVDAYLGEIICVDRLEEMERSPTGKAVMADGYQLRGVLNSRSRHYDNRPYIGQQGLERQKGFLQDQYESVRSDNQLLQPSLDAVERLKRQVTQERLAAESIHDDLWEAARLPAVQKKLNENIALLNRCREAGIEEKEDELDKAKGEIKRLEAEIEKLSQDSKITEIRHAKARQEPLKAAVDAARLALDGKINEVGASLVVSRKDALGGELAAAYEASSAAASACERKTGTLRTDAGVAWEKVQSYRREMAERYVTMKGDPDYEIEAQTNQKYAHLLERLAVKDMAATRSKAARERVNWQNLFRSTVAAKLNSALHKAEDLIRLMNMQLCRPIGNHAYSISKVENPDREYVTYRKLLETCAAAGEDGDLFASLEGDVRKDIEDLFTAIVEQPDSRNALQFLDYRNYHDYDLKASNVSDPTKTQTSVDKQSDKMSGGENQSPYFIAILACYLRAYRRHISERSAGPSMCLVPIDEAFSKMSGDGIRHSIDALQELGLQGFLSMSSGNIPYAVDGCDQVLTVTKKATRNAYGEAVRNIAVGLTRQEALARYCKQHDTDS